MISFVRYLHSVEGRATDDSVHNDVAMYCQCSRQTVQRIAQALACGSLHTLTQHERGKYSRPDDFMAYTATVDCIVRRLNHRGEPCSVGIIKAEVQEECHVDLTTRQVSRLLQRLGFKWKPTGSIKCYVETPGLTTLRKRYLERRLAIQERRHETELIDIFLDESYVNEHHSTTYTYVDGSVPRYMQGRDVRRMSKGRRMCMAHAGGRMGWVGNPLIFEARKGTQTHYQENMNSEIFLRWFRELCGWLSERGVVSVIHMDNAAYHKVSDEASISELGARKELLVGAVVQRGFATRIQAEAMTKDRLKQLLKARHYQPKNIAEMIADEFGHMILWIPPYHCEFDAIEEAWGISKNWLAKYRGNTPFREFPALIKRSFEQVTPAIWSKLVDRVEECERNWRHKLASEDEVAGTASTAVARVTFPDPVDSIVAEAETEAMEAEKEADESV